MALELIHSYKLAAVIDFAAADGVLAMTCAREARIPYLGFCLTPTHMTLLRAKLIQDAMKDSCKESDRRYDAKLAKLLAPKAGATTEESKKEVLPEEEESQDFRTHGTIGSHSYSGVLCVCVYIMCVCCCMCVCVHVCMFAYARY